MSSTQPEVVVVADRAELVAKNLPLIEYLAARMGRGSKEELVQETCLGILQFRNFATADITAAWFYYRVLNARTNLWRQSRARGAEADIDLVSATLPTPANQEFATDLALLAANDSLSDRQRELMARLLDGDNVKEAGEALGIKKQVAHKMLSRIRDTLNAAA